MSCNGYKHPKNCNCGMGAKSKTKRIRKEPINVKEKPAQQDDKVDQVDQPSSSVLSEHQEQGQFTGQGADQGAGASAQAKAVEMTAPASAPGRSPELSKLFDKLSTCGASPKPPVDTALPGQTVNPPVQTDTAQPGQTVKPPVQTDTAQPGQTVKPPDVKPPVPVDDKPPVGSSQTLSFMAKLSKYRPEDMPLMITSMAKAPFETMNAIKRTSRFTLKEREAQELAVQMIQCAEMFGWDVVNKWVMLFGLVSSIVILGAEKWRSPEPAAPAKKEEPKQDVKNPDGNAGGAGPGATVPVQDPEPKAIRLV